MVHTARLFLSDVFAIPECSLDQGPMNILPIVAHEWQQDGFLKPGVIVGIRPVGESAYQ